MSESVRADPGEVLWSRVDPDFLVASRAGDFLGYVDRHLDGGYGAYDGQSREIGLYPDQSSAARAVEQRYRDARPSETPNSTRIPEGTA